MKIRLVREAGGVGDLIRCFAVVQGLREKYPDAEIHLYGLANYRGMWIDGHCPGLGQYMNVHFHGRRGRLEPLDESKYSYLRRGIQYDEEHDLFCPAYVHEIETQGACVKERTHLWCDAAGVKTTTPVFHMTEKEKEWSKLWQKETDADPDKMIAIQPFTTTTARDYRNCHWVTLIAMLMEAGYYVTLLDCCPGRFRNFPASRKEVNRPWGQLAAIIAAHNLMVAPDSGLYHFAGAIGVHALGLFGQTNGKLIGSIWPKSSYMQLEEGDIEDKPLHCSPVCYGRRERGYSRDCIDNGCKFIAAIRPEDVYKKIVAIHNRVINRSV